MSKKVTNLLFAAAGMFQAADRADFKARVEAFDEANREWGRSENLLVHEVLEVARHIDEENGIRLARALERFVGVELES